MPATSRGYDGVEVKEDEGKTILSSHSSTSFSSSPLSSISTSTSNDTSTSPATSSSNNSSSNPPTPSFFPTPALDHAFAGITAGAIATICMNPLDLIKTQFQVDTSSSTTVRNPPPPPHTVPVHGPNIKSQAVHPDSNGLYKRIRRGKVFRDMYGALGEIVSRDGWKGLYRGLSPNVLGNSASWGLYFLWYTMIKENMAASQRSHLAGDQQKLTASQHLLAASESGAITALMTNPIWVVKTRMFTSPIRPNVASTSSSSSSTHPINPYTTLRSSLSHIYRTEGFSGLWKGAGLALFGVSNGAIQFMTYEQLKRSRSDAVIRKRRRAGEKIEEGEGEGALKDGQIKLSNAEYVAISGSAKLIAILSTYPYQVIRSRVQNHTSSHRYPTVRSCVWQTWRGEGWRGFYKGLATNLVRILPATCVTFVVYENVTWGLDKVARKRRGQRFKGLDAHIEEEEQEAVGILK